MSQYRNQYYNFSENELRDLHDRAKDGDCGSFNKLSEIIRSISFSYFKSKYNYGKLSSLDDADDLANDVFLTFAKQYQDIDSIEKWLRRVLFLTFVNFYKKKKSKLFFEFDETFSEENSDADFSGNFDSTKVEDLLKNLKDPKDKIIKMRFWEGLKFSEIAEKLNRNESAVKKMFYRTLNEIKKKLE